MKRLALVLLLAACQPVESEFPDIDGMTGVEVTQCTGRGGRIVRGLSGSVCAMPTSDAGQSCGAATDCSGLCLAPVGDGPGQCSPISPILGCYHILTQNGEKATICVD